MSDERKQVAIATHAEVLELLSESARDGSISAQIALERALRASARAGNTDLDAELDRLLTED